MAKSRRRLLVPSDTSIAQLHAILQVAFAWVGIHLHRFHFGGRECGESMERPWLLLQDEWLKERDLDLKCPMHGLPKMLHPTTPMCVAVKSAVSFALPRQPALKGQRNEK
jgi:hypothetical protein